MKKSHLGLALVAALVFASYGQAAFILEVDTDGADNGAITYNPDFSFGGDTTSASTSIPSTAFGMSGGNSIYGGNGVNEFDTYIYSYDPSSQADNLVIPANTDLGEGDLASGRTGGGTGSYDVYVTWPFTSTVSGGLTDYSVTTAGDSFSTFLNQNDVDLFGTDGRGHVWAKLGSINYTSGDITVTQSSRANSFVSMRFAGALFERTVPEPASLMLMGLACVGLGSMRTRS